MKKETWHLTFVTQGRRPVAPGEPMRRVIVRAILRVAGEHVVLFCVVDDHIHVVLLCARDVAGRLAQALFLAFRGIVGAPLRPAWISPVTSRKHMDELVGYVLTQTEHHGLPCETALWSGSCFADLVGARVVDGWTDNLAEAHPRFQVEEAYRLVGLPARRLAAVSRDRVRLGGAWTLADAAAFALATGPGLVGNSVPVAIARRVTVHLGTKAGIARGDLAEALGVTRAAIARLAGLPEVEKAFLATRFCIALRDAVTATASARPHAR